MASLNGEELNFDTLPLEEILDRLVEAVPGGIVLHLTQSEANRMVEEGDSLFIHQAVFNLVLKRIKAKPGSGPTSLVYGYEHPNTVHISPLTQQTTKGA